MTKGLSGRTYEKTGYLYENDFKEKVISKLGVANAIAFQSWQGLNENNMRNNMRFGLPNRLKFTFFLQLNKQLNNNFILREMYQITFIIHIQWLLLDNSKFNNYT